MNINTSRHTILILEDEPMSKKEMETLFPHSFTITKTITTALHTLQKRLSEFSLIIIDDLIQDPIEAIIKFRLSSKNIPIYIMTTSPTLKQKALRYGATGAMDAPFDVDSYNVIFNKHPHTSKITRKERITTI